MDALETDRIGKLESKIGVMSIRKTKILVISGAFPSSADPTRGIFVYQRVRALANLDGVDVRVMAPTPWAPPLSSVPKWNAYSKLPKSEVFGDLQIDRPRYFLPPKIGGYVHPQLMYPALLKAARNLRKEFRFDLIDAHFVYAAGVAATQVAKSVGVPICLTGRGEDMMRFPSMPIKGRSIRWALQNADAFVGVSRQISQAMIDHGADPNRVKTIANGVNVEQFKPLSKTECRKQLGLPLDRQILITVGDLLELKGFHVIIEALPKILKSHPNAMYVCVGGPGRHGRDHSGEIRSLVNRLNLENHVLLAGAQNHSDLPKWYNSADLYALASSREGSPNALLEALACGVPAVSTRVGGAPDELESTGFGMIMAERSAQAAAETVNKALADDWDSKKIREKLQDRSWDHIASSVIRHLSPMLPTPQPLTN